jgi:hypothetical protein
MGRCSRASIEFVPERTRAVPLPAKNYTLKPAEVTAGVLREAPECP